MKTSKTNLPLLREKTKLIPVFPKGLKTLKNFNTFLLFLFLCFPVFICIFLNSTKIYFLKNIFFMILGVIISAIISISIATQKSSSNWGTFSKKTEPVRFWIDIFVLFIFYSLIIFFSLS